MKIIQIILVLVLTTLAVSMAIKRKVPEGGACVKGNGCTCAAGLENSTGYCKKKKSMK